MAEESSSRYNVVFVYTSGAGGYEGVITWTSFESKEAFDRWWEEHPQLREREMVLEQGVSEERAIELADQTPLACSVAAQLQEATMEDGSVNLDIFDVGLNNVLLARMFRNRTIKVRTAAAPAG